VIDSESFSVVACEKKRHRLIELVRQNWLAKVSALPNRSIETELDLFNMT